MAAHAFYVLDLKGRILLTRNYRGDLPGNIVQRFMKRLLEEDELLLKPVIPDEGWNYVYIRHANIYLLLITEHNADAAVMLQYLHQVIDVFQDYFGDVEEESVRDNFVIVYELLDEMMDFGYPQTTEPKVLKSFITQESHKLSRKTHEVAVPKSVTGAVSWRAEGIVYRKNEVFLDIVEKINLLVASNGTLLRSEIQGSVQMRSYLSGMPELRLGLNDRVAFERSQASRQGQKAIELEDVNFHQCVKLTTFEKDRTVSFVPPDGEFELMSYRLSTSVKPLIWVEAIVESHKGSRVEYLVKARSQFKPRSSANDVEILVPVPPDADSPKFKTSMGTVKYAPEKDCIVWSIKQFPGSKEFLLRAHFGLPSVGSEEFVTPKVPIRINFEIPYFTVSGIQVRYLKVVEKSGYQSLPWVRYITQSGDYEVRLQ